MAQSEKRQRAYCDVFVGFLKRAKGIFIMSYFGCTFFIFSRFKKADAI
ncbi:hypothetical protein [Bartonella henselae]|nr:hypothetical protein [Bartonella henselae]